MKKFTLLFSLLALLNLSCGSVVNHVFSNKTPHEKYSEKIEDSPEGKSWLAASQKALEHPQLIQLPYRHRGYFHHDKSRALGLKFKAKQGQRIRIQLEQAIGAPAIYADLFHLAANHTEHAFSPSAEDSTFIIDIPKTGDYILRLQPRLHESVEYGLIINQGPSLSFPVSGPKAKTGSFWGDSRGGGKRSHEGIDIFAPKLTPALAAEDGYITGVNEGGLGGKTVWMKVHNQPYYLYYAHLDKQLVNGGDFVKKGDTLGLVGNTGNAKTTPPHLHFGVYTSAGPVDPFPFVDPSVSNPSAIPARNLAAKLKLEKPLRPSVGITVKENTLLTPIAVNAKGYIVELPGGELVTAPFNSVKTWVEPITTQVSMEKENSVATGTK
jgi:murein DD-endopeptidase MepM/ murein hydrolase activator NlpD